MKRPDPADHFRTGKNIAKMRKGGLSHQAALAVALQWKARRAKRELQAEILDRLTADENHTLQEVDSNQENVLP
jgi:hypothetical protein